MHLCGGDGPLTRTDSEEHQRQLRKKQKNRAAAQRSRQKHTNKADALHQVRGALNLGREEGSAAEIQKFLSAERKLCAGLQGHDKAPSAQACPQDASSLEGGDKKWRETGRAWHSDQHESLEKQNHALRKEIQALQAELAWWSQTLHVHERLCPLDCVSCLAPGAAGCWGQAERPPGPVPHGQHGCQEQLGLFRTPVSSPSAPQPSPDPQPAGSLGLLLSPLPSLSLGPAAVTATPAQSTSPAGSSLLRPSSKLNTLLPSPPAQAAPLESLRLEHPTRGKPGASPHSPSAAPGLGSLQDREHKPASSAADWQGPSPHPLLDFPLLSSAQVHF